MILCDFSLVVFSYLLFMEVNGFLVEMGRVSALHGEAVGAGAKVKGLLRGADIFPGAFPDIERRRLECAAE